MKSKTVVYLLYQRTQKILKWKKAMTLVRAIKHTILHVSCPKNRTEHVLAWVELVWCKHIPREQYVSICHKLSISCFNEKLKLFPTPFMFHWLSKSLLHSHLTSGLTLKRHGCKPGSVPWHKKLKPGIDNTESKYYKTGE